MSKPTVTILMGGPDAERNVSIQSGISVANALRDSGNYEVTEEVIDKPTLEDINNIQSDIVFPVLHGPWGEGGPLQELLELSGKTFVGSSSSTSRTAMDKVATKKIAKNLGIQTPNWSLISEQSTCNISAPLVLKPNDDGSSFDIAMCQTDDDVRAQRQLLHKKRPKLLAERLVNGKEITVGIIDGAPLPIIEIIPPKDLDSYDFEAKYERSDTQYIVEPLLADNTCIEDALKLYSAMNIRDIARVDFILNDTGAWLLELNTMPGFTDHSLIPMAARHKGIEMPELCELLVQNATSRQVKL